MTTADDELPASGHGTVPAAEVAAAHQLPIVFHGSGSEYFRIWAVNLLLTLVTLGLYYPWAKVRRLRYFYGNTFVGDHALDFHGDPKAMLRGFLLAALMAICYSVAGKVSPTAGVVAFLVVAVLWPALFWASQRFRLANTSWRGLRFRFNGTLAGSYGSMLPLFLPGLLVVLVVAVSTHADMSAEDRAQLGTRIWMVFPIIMLLGPLLLWLMKRYQHGHFVLGQIETRLGTGAGSFYLLALKTIGVTLALLAAVMVIGVVAGLVGALAHHLTDWRPGKGQFALIFAGIALFYLAFLSFMIPYVTSRLQNLVWGRTLSDDVRFDSRLRFWPFFWLTFRNLVLIVITLGLYAPFARIAVARMRLQAVSVQTAIDPDELVASERDRARPDATGDAAGDLFGFDIGW